MTSTVSFPYASYLPADQWVPASGGTEQPFTTRTGRRLLYVFNPRLGRHAYLDLGSDIVLTDDEAMTALGLL